MFGRQTAMLMQMFIWIESIQLIDRSSWKLCRHFNTPIRNKLGFECKLILRYCSISSGGSFFLNFYKIPFSKEIRHDGYLTCKKQNSNVDIYLIFNIYSFCLFIIRWTNNMYYNPWIFRGFLPNYLWPLVYCIILFLKSLENCIKTLAKPFIHPQAQV